MMSQPPTDRKFFTVEQANKMLPLVSRIIADITRLATSLRARQERLQHADLAAGGSLNDLHEEELHQAREEMEKDVEKVKEYQQELEDLGILLKDYFSGLVDFPCWMDGREVYLCWKQGESEVAWWHEIEAGFAGRQSVASCTSL